MCLYNSACIGWNKQSQDFYCLLLWGESLKRSLSLFFPSCSATLPFSQFSTVMRSPTFPTNHCQAFLSLFISKYIDCSSCFVVFVFSWLELFSPVLNSITLAHQPHLSCQSFQPSSLCQEQFLVVSKIQDLAAILCFPHLSVQPLSSGCFQD